MLGNNPPTFVGGLFFLGEIPMFADIATAKYYN